MASFSIGEIVDKLTGKEQKSAEVDVPSGSSEKKEEKKEEEKPEEKKEEIKEESSDKKDKPLSLIHI